LAHWRRKSVSVLPLWAKLSRDKSGISDHTKLVACECIIRKNVACGTINILTRV